MPTPADASTPYRTVPGIFVIATSVDDVRAASEAATLTGARVMVGVHPDDAAERLANQITLDVILIEAAGMTDAVLDIAIDAVVRTLDETDVRVVVALCADQIDVVAARLFGERVQLLCAPSLAERVTALAVASRPDIPTLNDVSRDNEQERLQRLNTEVARIAETLARLTRGGAGSEPGGYANGAGNGAANGGVHDHGFGYSAPPLSVGAGDPVAATAIRDTIRARRLRDQYFTPDLFADPAWDMLLDLYAALIEGTRVSVSSLCIAAAVPPTTALRWIATMSEAGLLERHADPLDRRRAYIGLSAKALGGMRGYFTALAKAGLAPG